MQNLKRNNDYQLIDEIITSCPKFVDLTNDKHSKLILETASRLSETYCELTIINKIEQQLISKNDESLIFILLALKIAKSKILISKIKESITISIVFAVYKEHNRIKKSF